MLAVNLIESQWYVSMWRIRSEEIPKNAANDLVNLNGIALANVMDISEDMRTP